MKIARQQKVSCCAGCPFVTGMGGGDEMPSSVRCTISDGKLIPQPRSTLKDYGDPPPPWCPLRKGDQGIVVSLKGR